MKGTTIPATSHNLWTGSRAIWLGVIILRHGGTASLRPVCLWTGTAYTAQVLYGPNLLRNNFRGFLLSFRGRIADLSRTHVNTLFINANTRTFRSMLTCSETSELSACRRYSRLFCTHITSFSPDFTVTSSRFITHECFSSAKQVTETIFENTSV